MKFILFVAGLAVSINGLFPQPAKAATTGPKYTLMKCGSISLGTMWVSFGHRYTSGESQVRHFPSEVIYVSEHKIQRRSYRNGKEALAESETQILGSTGITLSLHAPWGEPAESHVLSLGLADRRAPGTFKGSWQIVANGQVGAIDRSIRCTIL